MNFHLNSLDIHCNETGLIFFENQMPNRRFGVEIVPLTAISTNYNHYKVIWITVQRLNNAILELFKSIKCFCAFFILLHLNLMAFYVARQHVVLYDNYTAEYVIIVYI